ncbi:unnamed protein product [Phytophthora fragariaefolia]|uniref:Unnamed protein product n=1 Tax=Phytophthora fragariaefolia TaxID=1490495 RepID=A0A9W7DA32_9STRA|nr:unnamed protein product [Phytophthora fragariaefolia]
MGTSTPFTKAKTKRGRDAMTPVSAGLDAPQGAGLDALQGGEIDAPQAAALGAAQGTGLVQGHEEDRHHDNAIQQVSGGLPHCRLTGVVPKRRPRRQRRM